MRDFHLQSCASFLLLHGFSYFLPLMMPHHPLLHIWSLSSPFYILSPWKLFPFQFSHPLPCFFHTSILSSLATLHFPSILLLLSSHIHSAHLLSSLSSLPPPASLLLSAPFPTPPLFFASPLHLAKQNSTLSPSSFKQG